MNRAAIKIGSILLLAGGFFLAVSIAIAGEKYDPIYEKGYEKSGQEKGLQPFFG
jgi:hypothetical protein